MNDQITVEDRSNTVIVENSPENTVLVSDENISTQITVEDKSDTIIIGDSDNTVLITNEDITVIVTSAEQGPPGPVGPGGILNISDAHDIDKSNLEDGSVLVYSESQEKWIATRLLENQNIESGHY